MLSKGSGKEHQNLWCKTAKLVWAVLFDIEASQRYESCVNVTLTYIPFNSQTFFGSKLSSFLANIDSASSFCDIRLYLSAPLGSLLFANVVTHSFWRKKIPFAPIFLLQKSVFGQNIENSLTCLSGSSHWIWSCIKLFLYFGEVR